MQTEFQVVASRLCRIRGESDVVDEFAPLDDDGFLDSANQLDPADGDQRTTPGRLLAIENITTDALVLLGEPGIGKSTALEGLVVGQSERTVVRVDGAGITDASFPDLIGRHLAALRDATGAVGKGTPRTEGLILIIDQLDESPMIRRIPQALANASGTGRLVGAHVYVACRAADFPAKLSDVLADICGDCTVADLMPLTRAGAEQLADSIPDVDGKALVRAAIEGGAGGLASVPLTLNLLARSFATDGTLDVSPGRIFSRAIDQLLGLDADSAREPVSGSLDQRRVVAGRIAARLLLSGRRTVWTGRPLAEADHDVLGDSLVGGAEHVGDGEFEVTRRIVLETLGSALFAPRGSYRSAFRHGSIAAYLAARYLAQKDLAQDQLESLLLVAGPDEVRSIPIALRETAAWLVAILPSHASWLAHADPEGLVAHSGVVDVPVVRKAIVESLLDRAPDLELGQLPWRHSRWRLGHPDLGHQLGPILARTDEPNDWDERARVRMAVRLAEQTEAVELLEPLLRLAENDLWSATARSQAVRASMRIAPMSAAERLVAVMHRLHDTAYAHQTDPDDELLGTLLDALYPEHLGVGQILPYLRRQQNSNLFGMYIGFLLSFPRTLPEEALRDTLEWAAAQTLYDDDAEILHPSRTTDSPPQDSSSLPADLVFGLLDRATSGNTAADQLARVAAILRPLLFGHRQPPLPIGVTLGTESRGLTTEARNLSRALALELTEKRLENLEDENFDAWQIAHGWSNSRHWSADEYVPQGLVRLGRTSLLDASDLKWVYQVIEQRASVGDSRSVGLLANMANQIYDAFDDDVVTFVYERQSHPAWTTLKSRFDAVPLESDFARTMQRIHSRRAHVQGTNAEHDVVKAVERLDAQLDAAFAGDTKAFWIFTHDCQLDPVTGKGQALFAGEAVALPGFAALGPDAADRYDAAALRYLTLEHDRGEDWLGTETFDWRAWAGYLALRRLQDISLIDQLPDSAWRNWTSALLWFPAFDDASGESKRRLLQRCAGKAGKLLARGMCVYTTGEAARGSVPDLRQLPFDNQSLQDCGLEVLIALEAAWRQLSGGVGDPDANDLAASTATLAAWETLAGALFPHMPELLSDRLLGLWNGAEASSSALALRAAFALLSADPPGSWRSLVLSGLAQGDRLVALAASLDHSDAMASLDALETSELVASYELLCAVLPPESDVHTVGVHVVTDDEQARRIRDKFVELLVALGTDDAVRQLVELASSHPERLLLRASLLRARIAHFATAWSPPLPDEVARLVADAARRLVRSEEELLQLVERTLRSIESDYPGHADILWDRIPKRFLQGRLDEDGWLPKPESALSGYLTHELILRLHGRGMAVNREVLVRPTDAYGAGERTDILVEAVTTPTQHDQFRPRRLALVIEVKGAWNRGLLSEQRTQLAERYLPEANAGAGVFVVGWFPLEQWAAIGEQGRGRAAKLNPAKLDADLRSQAAEIERDLRRLVVPMRMTFGRPTRRN